jgi:circadian clock protein KaiC
MVRNMTQRAATGIVGLDDILYGGFSPHRLYLVEGVPGSGKTTLAFQFLMEGAKLGERSLYITLSETADEMREVALSHGWDLAGVQIRELSPGGQGPELTEQYSVFHPSEVELTETTRRILEDVERLQPSRVVFDSLSELRLLAGGALRYRRQILALKQYFAGRNCTVLMLDDLTGGAQDLQVQSVAHGALLLDVSLPAFGTMRRRLSVTKMRGSEFRTGWHDFEIRRGGLEIFPRLVAAEHRRPVVHQRMPSGIGELDALLGGGLECGTSTLIQGASGTGKSTLAAIFAARAAERGERSALFVFDESLSTLVTRLRGLGIDIERHIESGQILVRQIDPAEMSPGELTHAIREVVDRHEARIVVIDSLNGYLYSMPDEKFLIIQLHELLTFLGHRSVATVLISTQLGLIGQAMTSPVDASYLADTVLLLRYYEAEGEVRQALSVMKMRGSDHERAIREFRMRAGRIVVGAPLLDYHGILTGVPAKKSR